MFFITAKFQSKLTAICVASDYKIVERKKKPLNHERDDVRRLKIGEIPDAVSYLRFGH